MSKEHIDSCILIVEEIVVSMISDEFELCFIHELLSDLGQSLESLVEIWLLSYLVPERKSAQIQMGIILS